MKTLSRALEGWGKDYARLKEQWPAASDEEIDAMILEERNQRGMDERIREAPEWL